MPRPLSFQTKLLLAFTLTALITLGVGILSYSCFHTMSVQLVQSTRVDMPASHSVMMADMRHDALCVAVQRALLRSEAGDKDAATGIAVDIRESANIFAKSLATLDALPIDAESRQAITQVRPALEKYVAEGIRIANLAFSDRPAALKEMSAFEKSYSHLEEEMGRLDELLTARITANVTASNHSAKGGARTASLILTTVITGSIVSMLLGFGFGRYLKNRLNPLIDALGHNASETGTAVSQLTAGSHTLAAGTSENAASLEQSNETLDEMSSMTRRNAASAHTAKQLAAQTRASADTGASDMHEMAKAMDEITTSSRNVSRIIKIIDEIAFQTNILALNAAVEAARAGDAGMGFAVVADEVRALAQRSAEAARETSVSIEDAMRKCEHGAAISVRVEASLQEIVVKSREVDELASEIAVATEEQSNSIQQVHRAVTQIDRVTQSTAAHAQECASTAQMLNQQVKAAQDSVESVLRLIRGGEAKLTRKHAVEVSPKPAFKTRVSTRAASHIPFPEEETVGV